MRILGKLTLSSPAGDKIQNPLTNGKKAKKLREMHERNLGKAGLKPPGNPFR